MGHHPTIGEGWASGKFMFAISASYAAVQPDTISLSALSIPYASLSVLLLTPQ